jgi:exodeoxyribonuclease VIII
MPLDKDPQTMKLRTGFYTAEQLSNEEYHSGEGISCSGLKLIDRSPSHYKNKPSEETKPQFMGTATHAACLEPDRFAEHYVVAMASEFKDRRAAGFKAFREEHEEAGKIVLMEKEANHVYGMRDALAADPEASRLLKGAQFETSCYANDPVTGELCRVRADIISESGWVVDLKKCEDARPFAVAKAIANYDYHIQDPFYQDVFTWASPDSPPKGFAFIFVEEKPPHAIKVYVLREIDRDRGRAEYRRLLNIYHECRKTDNWPAYNTDPQFIDLPSWKRAEIDNRSIEDV